MPRLLVTTALVAALVCATAAPALAPTLQLGVAVQATVPDLTPIPVRVQVGASGYVTDVDVGVRIEHARAADLTLTLVSPRGTRIELSSQNPAVAGPAANYGTPGSDPSAGCAGTLTTFDDEAATGIGSAPAPFAGRFRPEQSLAALDGSSPTGPWTLETHDTVTGVTGRVRCFRLVLTTSDTIEVTTTADVVNPTDGRVSLREAMAMAVADGTESFITLQARATYPLACPAAGAAAVLDHDAGQALNIAGLGSTVRASCGTPLLRSTGSRTSILNLALQADAASGVGLRAVDARLTDVTVRGPFSTGVSAVGLTAQRLTVDGAVDGVVAEDRGGQANTLRASRITANSGRGVVAAGPLDVTDSEVSGNRTAGIAGQGAVGLLRTTVRDNGGTGVRGASVGLEDSSVTGSDIGVTDDPPAPALRVVGSTVSANRVGVRTAGPVVLDRATVAGNTGVDLEVGSGQVTSSRSALGTCTAAVATSGGHNASVDTSCGLAAAGSDLPALGDLRLGPLVFSSPAARLPGPGSLLPDAVPPPACGADHDIRAVARPQGRGCDIGAVEVRPPQGRDDVAPVRLGTRLAVDVLANDVDPDDQIDPGQLRVLSAPTRGSAVVSAGRIVYTPGTAAGADQLTYQVCSGPGGRGCTSAVLRLTVLPARTPDAPPPAGPGRPGYWLLESDGGITAFGAAPPFAGPMTAGTTAIAIAARPQGDGVWVLTGDGEIHARGAAADLGRVDLAGLLPGERLAAMSAAPDGLGVWVFTSRGRLLAFGSATPPDRMAGALGMVGMDLDEPVVDAAPTPSGRGAYLVAADGGVFALGDARFAGSVRGALTALLGPPGLPDQPVVGIVPDPDGDGYWIVARDGGVFSFRAAFRGSLPAIVPFERLAGPVVGMVPYGLGYLLVAGDGGIFNFSDLPFSGSGSGLVDSTVVDLAAAS